MKHVFNCSGHELLFPDITEGNGLYIKNRAGNYYMDLESGVWCMSLGHQRKEINQTIINQLGSLVQAGFCYSTRIVEEAAETVLEKTGMPDGKAVFLCSGSEAIEISRQIARHLTGKPLSMTMKDSYLGAFSSVGRRESGWYCFDWAGCANCVNADVCSADCPLISDIPDGISDFIFEPGSSSGFVRFPPKALIKTISDKVRKNGGKIIVNEVTTGIGRTGKWFGYNHYDIEPDMIAIGKGIGNGYPVSVAALNAGIIMELEGRPFKYAQSHQNDPLGAAVAREVIRVINENCLIEKAEINGRLFLEKLEGLEELDAVAQVRGRGLMYAIEFINPGLTKKIYLQLIDQGFLTGYRGSFLRIDPPLIITEHEFQFFFDALYSAAADVGVSPPAAE